MELPRSSLLGACLLALTSASHAQIVLSGTLSDATTGPLISGNVYHATGNLSVPSGQTLTVQPGVVVKFDFDRVFTVSGALVVNGTGPGSVVFTDLRDDTVGGDSNGDGNATMPAPGWWRSVSLGALSDASQVRGLEVRYAGRFGAAVLLSSSDSTFEDCLVRDTANHAYDFTGTSRPNMTRCSALNNAGTAFARVQLAAVPGLDQPSASGNIANWVDVTSASLAGGTSTTLAPQNGVNGVIHFSANPTLVSGGALTIEAGTILKMGFDRLFSVSGTLVVNGTAAQPVWFTDERDDAVGGDSNGDGAASAPAPDYWRYLDFRSGANGSTVEHLRVRYGGRFGAGLELNSNDATFSDIQVRDCSGVGVDLNGTSAPTMSNVTVQSCGATAFDGVPVRSLAGLTGLSAQGNGVDWVNVTTANITTGQGVTFGPQNGIHGVVHFDATLSIQASSQLTIAAGTICKFAFDRTVTVSGILQVNGTSGQAVFFTDERDDTLGGDSNGDGNSSAPSAGWWRGLQFASTSDGSVLRYAELRYGGRFSAGLEINSAAITVDRCRIRDFDNDGIDCNTNTEVCAFEHCVVDNCHGEAIARVRIDRLVDFTQPRGTGNDFDRIQVSYATISGPGTVTVDPLNQFNGAIYLASSVTVPSGATLNFLPGIVAKMGFDARIFVQGRLSIRGSLEDPVIFTDLRDDSVGGDTNGDGSATTPAPDWWRGIDFSSTSDVSTVLGAELRYGGRFMPQVYVRQSTAVLREVRSAFSSDDGFRFEAHPIEAVRLVAYRNSGDGIDLRSGGFNLRQATTVGNTGFGVNVAAAWTGDVVDTIAWNNVSGAYNGVGAGRVRYSDGSAALAGSDGNIDVNPQFIDELNGDLHLAQTSPCVNTGDPASPLDPDSTRADMGAYFFNFCEPTIFCPQALYPPCTPQLEYQSFCSLSSPLPFWIRLPNAPTQSFAVFFYGIGQPTLIPGGPFGDICVGGPYQRTAPVASGGNPVDGPCVGHFEFDFNAWAQGGLDPAIVAGANVIGTFWYRYGAAPNNALFSSALEIPVCP